jgi:hypothetical protein
LETKAFENVKNQMGYCAIWCGSCVVGNGSLKELTKRYDHIIEGYGINKWAAEEQGFNGQELTKTLQSIQNVPICRGCRKGGGAINCKIRTCASSRKLADCTECEEFMTCDNREPLRKVRTGAQAVGMLVKDGKDKTDNQQLMKKWNAEIRDQFPCCILFSHSQ